MSCGDGSLGASAHPPREPDCRFRTIRRYFDGPITARCVTCKRLVHIDEVGDQTVTMPCGATWALNTRSILQRGG
jgi:hypothetical protein